jgi:hypothetical protein
MCLSVSFGLYKVYVHCDCCEAMHACVGVCVLLCMRCMHTVFAARQCMRVWECVFGLVQGGCCAAQSWALEHSLSLFCTTMKYPSPVPKYSAMNM